MKRIFGHNGLCWALTLAFVLSLCSLPVRSQTRLWSERSTYALKEKKRLSSSGLRTTQYDGVHHLLGVYIDGGYSFFLNNVPVYYTHPGGYHAGLGFHYVYQHGPMLVQTGFGFRWQDIQDSIGPMRYTFNDVDSKNIPFRLTYDFYSRHDRTRNIYVSVPIAMGGYFGRFYALGGLKLNLQLWGNSAMDAVGSTSAEYVDAQGNSIFIGPLYQMDNHGLRKDVEIGNKGGRVKFGFDLLVTAELGYELPLSDKGTTSYRKSAEKDTRIRFALFAELGALNICPKSDAEMFTIPAATRYDFPTYSMTHTFSSSEASSYSIHNFFAGLRVSYFFFGHQSKEKCLLCGSHGFQSPWK